MLSALASACLSSRHQPARYYCLRQALQQGTIYVHLINRITRPRERLESHTSAQARRHARVALQLEHRNQPRDDDGGWRHILRGFFESSEHCHAALGEEAGAKVGGSP